MAYSVSSSTIASTTTTTTMDLGHQYTTVGLSGICSLVVIGAILNFVAFFTYLCKRRRKRAHIFPLCVAVVDFFNCVVLALGVLLRGHHGVSTTFEGVASSLHPYLTYVGVMVSAGLVIAIACERYSKVAYPFQVVAKERHWIVVLGVMVMGLLISFVIPLYRAVGYDKAWIPRNLTGDGVRMALISTSSKDDVDINDILTQPAILIPVIFHGVVLLLFLSGFILLFVKYAKLTKMIMSKRTLGHAKPLKKTRETDNVVLVHKDKSNIDIELASDSTNASFTCLAYNGDRNNNGDEVDFKVRESAVFAIHSPDYYRRLSHAIVPPQSVIRQPVTKKKRDSASIRASSLSIATRSRSRSPLKTMLLLIFAFVTFIFYFPNLVLALMNLIKPSVKEGLSSELQFVLDVLEYSYVLAFILNPILYAFCNRGFREDFTSAFGCKGVCGRYFRSRNSSLSTPKSSCANPCKPGAQLGNCRNETSPRYTYITEMQNKLLNMNFRTNY